MCTDSLLEKFKEKTEGLRYCKWLKKINSQIEKKRLDLELFQNEVITTSGVLIDDDEDSVQIVVEDGELEEEILETLNAWIW